jgi:hypothetical protein
MEKLYNDKAREKENENKTRERLLAIGNLQVI